MILSESHGNIISYISIEQILEAISHKTAAVRSPTTYLQNHPNKVWFDLVSLFNGISTYVGYLMPKLFFWKNSSGTI